MKKIKVALMQMKLGIPVTKTNSEILRSFRPHFICFPEYFFINKKLKPRTQTFHNFQRELKRIKTISDCTDSVVIGGTTLEPEGDKLYNTSFVYRNGRLLGSYRKQNLFEPEKDKVSPGDELKVFSAYGIKFGLIICADVFIEEYFIRMKEMGARIIFIPTFSPKRKETIEEKYKRDQDIFVKAAGTANAVIVKVCGVPSEFRPEIQARSLIADKNGILFRVTPDEENKEMIIARELKI